MQNPSQSAMALQSSSTTTATSTAAASSSSSTTASSTSSLDDLMALSPCCDSVRTVSLCPHMTDFKRKGGIESLAHVMRYLYSRTLTSYAKIQSDLPTPKCLVCKSVGGRLFVCLHCVFIGCSEHHAHAHFLEKNHYLVVDREQCELYCHLCKDYVYDIDADQVFAYEKTNALILISGVPYKEKKIRKDDRLLASKNAALHRVSQQMLGLRGLINLGNTCFMNCILQSLLHNPLFRNYFLSDMHNRATCERRENDICLACEMDRLFCEIFSGVRVPYTPANFLHSIWKYSEYFAGYEQQDAHEFLISALNGIHSHCGGSAKDCSCIVHRSFSGVMRSDVTCAKCGHTSTANDPFFDISLDVPKMPKRKPADGSADANAMELEEPGGTSLLECLERFTQAERLESEEKFKCSKCKSYQESLKQLSLKSLPLVICFHLKRFEQTVAFKRASSKIDTFVSFQEELNMGPFTSASILKKRRSLAGETIDPEDEIHDDYELFAVVIHHGRIDNGHYICFIKHSSSVWVKCDDAVLTKVSSSHVLQRNGYLLFYIRKNLSYSDKPTFVPTEVSLSASRS